MAEARCPSWDDLTAWWAGDGDAVRDAEIDEHLLACDGCARRAADLARLADGVAGAARSGAVGGPVAPGLLRRLEADGVRLHRYPIAPGQVVPCSVWPEDEVMVAQLATGAAGGGPGRLDLVLEPDGEAPLRVADVPVDPATGTLSWLSAASAERRRPAGRLFFRLVRVSDAGEATVGEFTLAHEPWTGPGSPR